MNKWYVIWTLTGKELDVLDAIRGAPGVEQALCPTERLWYRQGGGWEQREQVMIPGYVFIRCSMSTTVYYRVRGTPCVIGWLGSDSMWPSVVPEAEMAPVIKISTGRDPASQLSDVTIDRRKRRGHGTLTLQGKPQKIVFTPRTDDKQPEREQVDQSPADGGGDQNQDEIAAGAADSEAIH